MRDVPAVVIPADRPATLGFARSLGRRGIPVHVIDADRRAYGLVSKYVKPIVLPCGDDSDAIRLQVLMDLGRTLGHAVLFPVRDDDVLLCSRHRMELARHYSFVMPAHEIMEDLVTKDGLRRIAEHTSIEAPQTFVPGSRERLVNALPGFPYPVILKPVFSPSWLREEITSILREGSLSNPPKVALCRDPDELLRTYDRIAPFDDRMIVQEVIAGEDARLAYCCFYVDRKGRPRAVFSGRKVRVLPVGFGSASYVRSVHDPDLERVTLRLLEGASYRGLGGVEFKKDVRDERYKLIEFNARFGLWDSLSVRCGIDIPFLAYEDALERPIETQASYRDGIIWLDSQRDVRAFLIYRRLGRLGTKEWLKSLVGEKDWAVYSPDDPRPALRATAHLLDRPWAFIKRRLGSGPPRAPVTR